ncbi:MAG: DUF523 domain-containing protein [Candidatus Riflebacteria bacterium]|nr:DUF523 domain-containing protein [Candidatus Riflebacteria bacterium]
MGLSDPPVPRPVILISGCLLGLRCTWRGQAAGAWSQRFQSLIRAAREGGPVFIPACPEQLGGLPTPRPPAELMTSASRVLDGNGLVLNGKGEDVTAAYRRGAAEAVHLARVAGARLAVLKERSPSCGARAVHAGLFNGALAGGRGVAAEALHREGFIVLDEEEFLRLWRATPNWSGLDNPLPFLS